MDIVFTLTKYDHDSRNEEYVHTSQNIYDILDKMFDVGYAEINDYKIYVTEHGRDAVPYKEWRKQ